ncbi:MAG TPA: hypothetical protein VFJ85_01025 [Acidimicrobiales bacterium]|nr:hypothetical protein [Acidimicrobiales bacterium]
MGSDELAPVIPLRSDEEDLELLETAVLDALDERDAEEDDGGGSLGPVGDR